MLRAFSQATIQGLKMDPRPFFCFSSGVFGFRASSFLSRLNLDHPDLRREPFASFLDEAVQTARCASFCGDNGLLSPLKAVSASAPRSHALFFAACRLLNEDARTSERCRKIPMWLDFKGLKNDPLSLSPDLPQSFDRFRTSSGGGDAWSAMESLFVSAGCLSMAESARATATEYARDESGLAALSIRRAILILGRRLGIWSSDRILHPVAIPTCLTRLPEWALRSIESSEVGLSGHSIFDHHVAVCFLDRASVPNSLDEGIVILGERDGVFHFVCSD